MKISNFVLCGGGWNFIIVYCRVASRYDWGPGYRDYDLEFRLSL